MLTDIEMNSSDTRRCDERSHLQPTTRHRVAHIEALNRLLAILPVKAMRPTLGAISAAGSCRRPAPNAYQRGRVNTNRTWRSVTHSHRLSFVATESREMGPAQPRRTARTRWVAVTARRAGR